MKSIQKASLYICFRNGAETSLSFDRLSIQKYKKEVPKLLRADLSQENEIDHGDQRSKTLS